MTIAEWKKGLVMAIQRSIAMAHPSSKGHKPKNTILAPKIWQNASVGITICILYHDSTCRYKANAPGITWPPRSANSKATVRNRNGALDWRRNRARDLAKIARAVRLEMAPNAIVKQDMPNPENVMSGPVVPFSQGLCSSEELTFRFWWRMDGVEEGENDVMSKDGVLIFSVIYREFRQS